jgi:hypothetical protein
MELLFDGCLTQIKHFESQRKAQIASHTISIDRDDAIVYLSDIADGLSFYIISALALLAVSRVVNDQPKGSNQSDVQILESFKTPDIAKQVLVGWAIVIDEANCRDRQAWFYHHLMRGKLSQSYSRQCNESGVRCICPVLPEAETCKDVLRVG